MRFGNQGKLSSDSLQLLEALIIVKVIIIIIMIVLNTFYFLPIYPPTHLYNSTSALRKLENSFNGMAQQTYLLFDPNKRKKRKEEGERKKYPSHKYVLQVYLHLLGKQFLTSYVRQTVDYYFVLAEGRKRIEKNN